MKKIIFIFFAICLFRVNALAQENVMTNDSTSVVLPSLVEIYYSDNSYLNHNYQYELLNLKRSYEYKANSMSVLATIGLIGGCLAYDIYAMNVGLLDMDANGKLWSSMGQIMISGVCGVSLAVPFFILAQKYNRKAQAIDISTSYLFEMDNGKVYIGPSMMRINNDLCQKSEIGFGLSITTTF